MVEEDSCGEERELEAEMLIYLLVLLTLHIHALRT